MLLVLTLALPVRTWRTGELDAPPLATAPGAPIGTAPLRVWIDTDAACGRGRRTDPDDCFAIVLLAGAPEVRIAGVSTVFGNAPLAETDSTTRALVRQFGSGVAPVPVFRGAAGPLGEDGATPAAEALQRALAEGPLVIAALGPLTNVAQALEGRPDLAGRVQRLVAVMGRRRGHLFHPVEGGHANSFLGHGPVFRDFNFAQDAAAAASVVALDVPLALVPYEAARSVAATGATLDAMAARGGPGAWAAARARHWLDYWREEIGTRGFYPFDLLAAAYTLEPANFLCADTRASVGRDAGMLGWLGRTGLFVEPGHGTLYCPDVGPALTAWLAARGIPVERARGD